MLKLTAALALLAGAATARAETPSIVTLETLAVPIVDNGHIEGRLELGLALVATDEQAATRLALGAPRLQATAMAAALEFARLHATPFRAVDVGALLARVAPALRGPDVSRVLVLKVMARRD